MTALDSSQWMYSSASGFYPHTIDQSLRMEDGDSGYLWRQAGSSGGDGKTWTFSAWVKRANLDAGNSYMGLLAAYQVSPYYNTYITFNTSSQTLEFGHGATVFRRTNQVFRDVAAFYHIQVVLDTTESTASDRVKIYINGEQITSFSSSSDPSLNSAYFVNADNQYHGIGTIFASGSANYFFDGYMAEVNLVGGSGLTPTSFGETKAGIWIPKDTGSLSFGTHGFRLKFQDSSALGDDTSGNGNDLTTVNFAATDVVLDSPTNNWCTLSSIDKDPSTGATLSEGNLKMATQNSDYGRTNATFGMSNGKWYWEARNGGGGREALGISQLSGANGGIFGGDATDYIYRGVDGLKQNNGTTSSYGNTYTTGDIIGVAYDADNGDLFFYKNGTIQNSGTEAFGSLSGTFLPTFGDVSGINDAIWNINFGQDSSFAGNETAQGNADVNGNGDFYYSPPSGFLCLASVSLPDPAIDPAQDEEPTDYFNTVLWTGDNASSRSITGVGHAPNFVWIKTRNQANEHSLFDSVRGVAKDLESNSANAEQANNIYGYITSFDSDGFTVGAGTSGAHLVNYNVGTANTYVAWNWLAGGSAVSNTDGGITSSVSANTKAGFSIVSYSGTGSITTVGHGLNSAPEMIIIKNRNSNQQWPTYVEGASATAGAYFLLNKTDAVATDDANFNNVNPTSSVFTVTDADGDTGRSGSTYIAYCFHSVDGYSKIGRGTGSGSSSINFIHTGFRPAWVLIKRTDSSDSWIIFDNKRPSYNVTPNRLFPNSTSSESTSSSNQIDMVSNGFVARGTSATWNTSGSSFIYLAFADQPQKYSNAR